MSLSKKQLDDLIDEVAATYVLDRPQILANALLQDLVRDAMAEFRDAILTQSESPLEELRAQIICGAQIDSSDHLDSVCQLPLGHALEHRPESFWEIIDAPPSRFCVCGHEEVDHHEWRNGRRLSCRYDVGAEHLCDGFELAHPETNECYTCGEDVEHLASWQCPQSKRSCGHHCNCSWENDECHWCGRQFGEVGQ